MKTKNHSALYQAAIIFTGFLLGITSLQAALVNFQNFNDLSSFTLNGASALINTGGQGVIGPNSGDTGSNRVLRLTNDLSQSGSAFLTTPFSLAADASFSSFFEFQFTNQQNGGADGIVFAIQTVANTSGGLGGGIGFAGLAPSIGVEFDNWNNGTGDGNNDNHAGININGNMNSVVRADLLPAGLDSGAVFRAWVDYNGVTDLLEVRLALDDNRPVNALMSHTVDLVSLLGTTNVFAGFTSGTGGAGADHDIRRWILDGQFNPITDPGNPGGGSTVPEPSSLALLGLALVSFLVVQRRRFMV